MGPTELPSNPTDPLGLQAPAPRHRRLGAVTQAFPWDGPPDSVVVFGGDGGGGDEGLRNDTGILDPATGTWRPLEVAPGASFFGLRNPPPAFCESILQISFRYPSGTPKIVPCHSCQPISSIPAAFPDGFQLSGTTNRPVRVAAGCRRPTGPPPPPQRRFVRGTGPFLGPSASSPATSRKPASRFFPVSNLPPCLTPKKGCVLEKT